MINRILSVRTGVGSCELVSSFLCHCCSSTSIRASRGEQRQVFKRVASGCTGLKEVSAATNRSAPVVNVGMLVFPDFDTLPPSSETCVTM